MSGGENPANDEAWEAARRRYELGAEPVAAIARDIGLSAMQLGKAARSRGWQVRAPARSKPKADRTDDTINRLKALLQTRLGELEAQIGSLGAEASAASNERDIRALNGLVRTLEKVMELERKDRMRRSRERKQFRSLDDAERDALAAKLDGLQREHAGAADPRRSEQQGGGGPQP